MTLLVGPIASGKSTYARKLAQQGALVVCDDAIVLAVHGGNYGLYADALKPLYTSVENAIISHAALAGRDVVIDRGCRNRATRARFLRAGVSLGYEVVARVFPWRQHGDHVRDRYESDPRGLSLSDWSRIHSAHAREYEPVGDDENFAEIVSHE